MTTYTYAQLEQLWINNGGPPSVAPIAAAIAEAESQGDSSNNNYNDTNGQGGTQTSWGLWQISDGTHGMPVPNINDPNVNAQQAVAKYQASGWQPWGTYTSGAYKAYISGSTTPDPNVPASGTLTAATGSSGGQPVACLVGPLPHTSFCLLSKSEARGMLGGVMLVAGALLVLPGLIILAAAGFASTGAGRGVTQAAGAVPGYGRVISAATRRRAAGNDDEGLEEPTRPGERISDSERRTALANRRQLQASRPAPKVRAGGSQVSQDFADRYMS